MDSAVKNDVKQDDPDAVIDQAPSYDISGADNRAADALMSAADNGVRLNKDILILYDTPLSALDKGDVKAFKAQGSGKVPVNLFALICARHLTPRASIANKYAAIINPDMAKIVASGKVKWTDGKEYYAFIFEDTLGAPLVNRSNKYPALGWKPETVLTNVIKPMIHVLMDLRDKDIVHGEIWPGNIFDGGSAAKDKVRLGECMSAPPSALLPALYEPIERAMADPVGRGLGTIEDDLYAFGVSLAVILRTVDPMEGASDEKIIASKIEKGTYATLISRDRFSGAVLELLRGLLYDDKNQRWGFDEIQAWMDGRRLSPKQSPKRIKANRPLEFNGKKYIRPELLAKDLSKNTLEAVRLVDNGELQMWLDRAMEDKSIRGRMEPTLNDMPSSRGENFSKKLATRVAIALNPDMPIDYNGLKFMPDGFGKLFSQAYVLKKDLQPFIEVIKGVFMLQIIRQKPSVDQSALINKFDSARAYISQTKIGSGLERCLYSFDKDAPCFSHVLDDHYVLEPEDLVRALDDIAKKKIRPERLLDRHMIAFLSVKDRKNVDPYIIELGANERHKQVMGEVRVLATIQKRSQLEDFPALAAWIAERFAPVYERFHDRQKRESLKRHVTKVAATGDLTRLAVIFEDEHLYQNDFYTFKQAMDEFQSLEKERILIEEKLKMKKGYGLKSGRQIASFIALFISMASILLIAFKILSSNANL